MRLLGIMQLAGKTIIHFKLSRHFQDVFLRHKLSWMTLKTWKTFLFNLQTVHTTFPLSPVGTKQSNLILHNPNWIHDECVFEGNSVAQREAVKRHLMSHLCMHDIKCRTNNSMKKGKVFPSCTHRKFRICVIDENVFFASLLKRKIWGNLENVKIAKQIYLHFSCEMRMRLNVNLSQGFLMKGLKLLDFPKDGLPTKTFLFSFFFSCSNVMFSLRLFHILIHYLVISVNILLKWSQLFPLDELSQKKTNSPTPVA